MHSASGLYIAGVSLFTIQLYAVAEVYCLGELYRIHLGVYGINWSYQGRISPSTSGKRACNACIAFVDIEVEQRASIESTYGGKDVLYRGKCLHGANFHGFRG